MIEPEDRRLVAAITSRGDERAFGVLYDRYTFVLYRLALRLTGGNEPEAQEIVHDAWVRAVERLATFGWHSALRTWLSGIVVNRWREMARAESRDVRESIEELGLGADDQRLSGTFDRIDLERAIASLAPRYREVFVLHDVEGYAHEEIAELLGVEPGTSKSQLSRARRALRAVLGTERNAP